MFEVVFQFSKQYCPTECGRWYASYDESPWGDCPQKGDNVYIGTDQFKVASIERHLPSGKIIVVLDPPVSGILTEKNLFDWHFQPHNSHQPGGRCECN